MKRGRFGTGMMCEKEITGDSKEGAQRQIPLEEGE